MNLLTFLDHIKIADFFTDKCCIAFRGCTDYPVLFFVSVLKRMKNSSIYPIESIDLATHDAATIIAKCEMNFLGMQSIYWLHDISVLDDKSRKQLLGYLKAYRGPNIVIFFASELPSSWESLTVDLVDKVDKQLYAKIMLKELGGDIHKNAQFINAVFSKTDSITLESAYALMRYSSLIGTSQSLFIEQWLESIIVPEKSLFTLGNHFFAKDAYNFFALWSTLSDTYADIFWISFWSEQVWRAHNYIRLMHEKKFSEAKTISFRLPFSLVQRDWKKISLHELQQVHEALYALDYHVKNGGTIGSLDLVYSKFFAGHYKKV